MKSQRISILIAGVIFSAVFASQSPRPGRLMRKVPRVDVRRLAGQVHRLRRADVQRRVAALSQVQRTDGISASIAWPSSATGTKRPLKRRRAALRRPPVQPSHSEKRQTTAPAWTVPATRSTLQPAATALNRSRHCSDGGNLRPRRTARRPCRPSRRAETPARSGSAAPQTEADQSGQAGHLHLRQVAVPMEITNPGTRNEGRWGWLTYDGQKLPRGNVNDYLHHALGTDVLGRSSDDQLGPARFHADSAAAETREARAASAAPGSPPPMSSLRRCWPLRRPCRDPPKARLEVRRPQNAGKVNRSHNGQLARLHVGNVLIIRLPGNPATGYQWQAARRTARPADDRPPQYSPPCTDPADRGAPTPSSIRPCSPARVRSAFYDVRAERSRAIRGTCSRSA